MQARPDRRAPAIRGPRDRRPSTDGPSAPAAAPAVYVSRPPSSTASRTPSWSPCSPTDDSHRVLGETRCAWAVRRLHGAVLPPRSCAAPPFPTTQQAGSGVAALGLRTAAVRSASQTLSRHTQILGRQGSVGISPAARRHTAKHHHRGGRRACCSSPPHDTVALAVSHTKVSHGVQATLNLRYASSSPRHRPRARASARLPRGRRLQASGPRAQPRAPRASSAPLRPPRPAGCRRLGESRLTLSTYRSITCASVVVGTRSRRTPIPRDRPPPEQQEFLRETTDLAMAAAAHSVGPRRTLQQ